MRDSISPAKERVREYPPSLSAHLVLLIGDASTSKGDGMTPALELFKALAAQETGRELTQRERSLIRDHRLVVDKRRRQLERKWQLLRERDDD